MKKIVIIGAGVSGIYAAILLKQKLTDLCMVTVLEQNASPLKKLLATGNGRCNLSNRHLDKDCFWSDSNDYVFDIVTDFDIVKALDDIGLYCVYHGDLLYPKSEQALSVKDILITRAEELGVAIHYHQDVCEINTNNNYSVKTSQTTYDCDYIIYAMGSEAGKLSGINSSRYDMLKHIGLHIIKPTPALVQMKTSPVMKSWKGIRVKGLFSLRENGHVIHCEEGELLFTDYGVSGIAVMKLSAYYHAEKDYQISIDFFQGMDLSELQEYIEVRLNKGYNNIYDGLMHTKIATHFQSKGYESSFDIAKHLKDFRLNITGLRSYETAQVMKGGLALSEVDQNLQIQRYQRMYAVGEILNVAGQCGGYNLHFAFASASRVAKSIERELHVKNK